VAVRAFSFPASIVPVILGSAYAFYDFRRGNAEGSFNWALFALALLAGMLYHIGCNLINDYYDHRHGLDREGAFGGSGVLVSRAMSPREIMSGAVLTLALGSLIGLILVWRMHSAGIQYGWPLLAIGAAGLIGAIWYTSGRGSAKYNALGSPLVFLMMGTGMVLGAYVVQTGQLSWGAALASLPVGFLVAAILQANDVRDIVDDRAAGIQTIATLLGPVGARGYYAFLVLAPYASLGVLVALRLLPLWSLLAIVTLPLALQLCKLFFSVKEEKSELLHPTVENTAKLHMGFGLLMTIGVVIGGLLIR
jgi:1,4-dihydroxy-2-naphthoate polyprenyltransferase